MRSLKSAVIKNRHLYFNYTNSHYYFHNTKALTISLPLEVRLEALLTL